MGDENKNNNDPVKDQSQAMNDDLKQVIENLKQEMNRKFENQNTNINSIKQEQVPPAQAPQSNQQKSMGDLMYEDPEAYANLIAANAAKEASAKLETYNNEQQERTNTMVQLTQAYPELNQADSELVKKTLNILGAFPANQQQNPANYKVAVYQAASELGMQPAKYRNNKSKETFALGSGGKTNQSNEEGEFEGIDPMTIEWAKALGVNLDDPKRVDSLKKAAERSNWLKYSGKSGKR